MRIVVIGGTGLIGSQVVGHLADHGHEVVAASPNSGVNSVTGEGVAEALAGAQVVVDVSNSPSFADDDVMAFFRDSTGNLLAAARDAGLGHYVALSIVGSEHLVASGYMRAKVEQERMIRDGGVPYTIVHATQFLEFLVGIADSGTVDGVVRVPQANIQPVAATDVALAVAKAAAHEPTNGIVEIAGPEVFTFADIIGRRLAARGDEREVVADPDGIYFGENLTGDELVAAADAPRGAITYDQWIALPGNAER
ncbi:SDR family oxidoreductase [Pseudolysinimonas sp.]